jgi:hypothetical protein
MTFEAEAPEGAVRVRSARVSGEDEPPPSATAAGCAARAAVYRENAMQMSRMADATSLPGVARKFAVAADRWRMLAAAEDAIARPRAPRP